MEFALKKYNYRYTGLISKGNFGLATEATSQSSQKPVTLYLNLSRFSCWTTRWLYRFIFVLKLFWQPTTSHCNNNDNTKHHGALQHQTWNQYCNHCISKHMTQVLATSVVDMFYKKISTTQRGSFLGVVWQASVKVWWSAPGNICVSNWWCVGKYKPANSRGSLHHRLAVAWVNWLIITSLLRNAC